MGKELRATFAFLCLHKDEARRPERNQIPQLVKKITDVSESLGYTFSKVFLYLEIEKEPLPIRSPQLIGDYDTVIGQVTLAQLNRKLEEKLVEEERAKKTPGHESYQPSAIMTTDTCIVVMGSRRFCSAIARAHMVEVGQLLPKLVQILDQLNGLEPYTGRAQIEPHDFLVFSVKPDRPMNDEKRDELTYNIQWWYDNIFDTMPRTARSLDELLALRKGDG